MKDGCALVAWKNCCTPKDRGGLGLKDLFTLNKSLLLKRCWDVVTRITPSAILLHDRFLTPGLLPSSYYKKSSIWLGLKKLWPQFHANLQWVVGDGRLIRFWKDNWLGETLVNPFHCSPDFLPFLDDKVCTFIHNNEWRIPWSFQLVHPQAAAAIYSVPLPTIDVPDQPVWALERSGVLTAQSAYSCLADPRPRVRWGSKIWHGAIQPRKSLVTWKVLLNRIPTDDLLQRRGSVLCSRCQLCKSNSESTSHLFVTCEASLLIWHWVVSLFRLRFDPGLSLVDLLEGNFVSSLSISSKLLWYISFCNILWSFWMERNRLKHDGGDFNEVNFKQRLILSFKESASLVFTPSSNPQSLPIFVLLGLSPLRPTAPRVVQVLWHPPPIHWVKVNTDGSFHGPSLAGYGGIFRTSEAEFLGAFSARVAVPSALDAEMLAVIEAVRLAWTNGWHNLWLEVDSLLLLKYFKVPLSVPWHLRTIWGNFLQTTRQMNVHISHIFREGNSVADKLANYGASSNNYVWWDLLPPFLYSSFGQDLSFCPRYRFS